MAKIKRREKDRKIRTVNEFDDGFYEYEYPSIAPFEPVKPAQVDYYNAMNDNIVTFGVGAAGTGKSFVAIAYACEQLLKRKVKKVVFTRPAVECDEKYGYLTGDLNEKLEPYYLPIRDNLHKRIGRGHADYYIRRSIIEFRPLAYMRGSTFENSIVILDEAQNVTPAQMKMFLTRVGDDCKVIINGDIAQSDIKGNSGLYDAIHRLKNVRRVAVVEFTFEDCVRSGICKEILRAYQ